jgi:hypothetical protein
MTGFLLAPTLLEAQDSLSVKASTDRKSILIGEPFHLLLQARIPEGTQRHWFELDTIPHFDILSRGDLDSSYEAGNMVFRQQLVLTSFDSGSQVIPRLACLLGNRKFLTDSIQLEVNYSNIDPRQDYHDIKDIIEVENPLVKWIVWGLLAVTLAAVAGTIYFLRRKAGRLGTEKKEPVSNLSPFEEAMKAMQELKQRQLTRSGQTKMYYSRLNDILRVFVHRKLDISSMEKTNEELVAQLKKMEISRDNYAQLAEALRMSDSVKFAKYQPDETKNEMNFEIIESSIRLLDEIQK